MQSIINLIIYSNKTYMGLALFSLKIWHYIHFLPLYEKIKAYVMRRSEVSYGMEEFCKSINHY